MKVSQILKFLYYRLLPIKKNTVLFDSFAGQYNDNPKYISEWLHEIDPKIKIVWTTSSKNKDVRPAYVLTVAYGTDTYQEYVYTSEVVVDNHMGLTVYKKTLLRSLLYKWIPKRKRQLTISTWHGTPLKKIGLYDIGSKCKITNEMQIMSDYIIAGCHHTATVLSYSFCKFYPVFLTGTPRNDILVNGQVAKEDIKLKLKLPPDKKVLLFAPTFRDSIKQSGDMQMQMLDIRTLLDHCKNTFDGDWVFVLRVHDSVIHLINTSNYRSSDIFDGNIGDDMAEYLACADILITDYSGSMFDFALTGRPCLLFAPDREQYEKHERGLYIEYDSLPFPIAYTNEQLVEAIKTFDKVNYKMKIIQFLETIGNVEDGNASERIANCIVHFIATGEKRLESVKGVNLNE